MPVVVHNGQATSLPASPFGGVAVAANVPQAALKQLLLAAIQWLRHHQVPRFTLVGSPEAYQPALQPELSTVLKELGFALHQQATNHHLPVQQQPFSEGLHPMERRRLKKCQQAGFEVRQEADLARAYTCIAQWRAQKNMPLSLTQSQLLQEVARYPAAYKAFMVYHNGQPVAGTIAVRVHPEIIYNFYPASDTAYNTYSPMVQLIEGLYHYAQHEGCRLVDLGTSMLGAEVNTSLARFKAHLGGVAGTKPTYTLTLTAAPV